MQIRYEGREIEIKDGATGFDLVKEFDPDRKKEVVALQGKERERSLREPLLPGDELSPILIGSKEAFHLLNHSTSHLMAQAIRHLYPEARFGVGPAIEEGFYYDVDPGEGKTIAESDLPRIEEEMRKLSKENIPFERMECSMEEALSLFPGDPYKDELIKEHGAEGISLYRQGDFLDLCRGPHVPSTGYIKHFRLLSVAGAYWRGDSRNKQLTRIYGTSFWSKEELENYLELLEKRKRNDHRRLGKELGLFFISEYGPGFPFFLPKGMELKNHLLSYWREIHHKYGYQEIETPTILSRELWETSGHWDHYKENMYVTKIDDRDFAIKPMNCPGAILVYKNEIHSYRELPLRYAELGHVHRHEASGALNGLFRVRAFTQDDSHIFIREDQIEDEVKNIMALFDEVYSLFGLSYRIVLSTRPEEGYIGTPEFWDKAEAALAKACLDSGHEYQVNPGDGAFYGPKLDFKLKDSMGRTWQCGTIQLDLNLPHRFGCTYVDENGEKKEPVMLHRVVFGSIERFIGIITENYGGAFPAWLAPKAARILPVKKEAHGAYAKEVLALLEKAGVPAEIDDSEEKLGYRLRKSQVEKVPYVLVLGDMEAEGRSVNLRAFGSEKQESLSLEEAIERLSAEVQERK